MSAGAADTSRKDVTKSSITHNASATSSDDNITALEISADPQSDTWRNTSITSTNSESIEQLDVDKTNITIIKVSANDTNELKQQKETKTSAKVSSKRVTGEIFKFPESTQTEYKSNVQIIPSTKLNSSTIQVLGTKTTTTTTTTTTPPPPPKTTPYATPVKKSNHNISAATTTANLPADEFKITTVHVTGNNAVVAAKIQDVRNTIVSSDVSLYGTCYTSAPSSSTAQPANASSIDGTPKMMKKIILSANTSGVTNITVDNASTSNRTERYASAPDAAIKHNVGAVHYEKVFLSTSIPPESGVASNTTLISTVMTTAPPLSPTLISNSTTHTRAEVKQFFICNFLHFFITLKLIYCFYNSKVASNSTDKSDNEYISKPSSPIPRSDAHKQIKPKAAARTVSPTVTAHVELPSLPPKSRHKSMQSPLMARAHPPNVSPMLERRRITTANLLTRATTSSPPPPTSHHVTPTLVTPNTTTTNTKFPLPSRGHLLTRGLTEAVITTRPSRRDFHLFKASAGKGKPTAVVGNKSGSAVTSNNNGDSVSVAQPSTSTGSSSNAPQPNRSRNSELLEQRRRSSSTSDARTGATRGANNNELPGVRNTALRFQHPPQPFRNAENGLANGSGNGGVAGSNIGLSSPLPSPSGANNSPANKRMTLREHQVMQLRREIMHPGGVRLQLRRKDCLGSIAWVDAFGAVW